MGGVGPAARDEFAPDSPLQQGVCCEPAFKAHPVMPAFVAAATCTSTLTPRSKKRHSVHEARRARAIAHRLPANPEAGRRPPVLQLFSDGRQKQGRSENNQACPVRCHSAWSRIRAVSVLIVAPARPSAASDQNRLPAAWPSLSAINPHAHRRGLRARQGEREKPRPQTPAHPEPAPSEHVQQVAGGSGQPVKSRHHHQSPSRARLSSIPRS
jgi:hypothetical protein